VKHWAHGGETSLANLVTLCRFHHRQVHEGKVVVQTLDDGAFRFVRPDGNSFDSPPPAGDWETLVAIQAEGHIVVTPKTAVANWTGGGFDLGLGVEVLMQQYRLGKANFQVDR
jgi:hypothetical protein